MIRYSETDLRRVLPRSIWLRWPQERLVLLTPCRLEPVRVGMEMASGGAHGHRHSQPRAHPVAGFVAATQARLVYEERANAMALVRAFVTLFAVLTAAALITGNLMMFLTLGTVALVSWAAGRAIEPLALARAQFSFDQVAACDERTQRIETVGWRGERASLHVPERSDFMLIAALVEGRGRETAA